VTRTKKKKQEKLKRQVASIRRANKKEEGISNEARFAAMTLVNDPQAFAERLFHRLQAGTALTFDTKMLLIQVLSRVVGLHRLHLMHLYPFLQRYVQPNQRDVTKLLAACATACHELVPPDALEPLLKQLVNQFVHDRARPEVVAVGINTVREICLRCPLVMHADLLQDLAQYKRARDKPVATAARALISLFRELAPGMLEKKDRGKGAFFFFFFSRRDAEPVFALVFERPRAERPALRRRTRRPLDPLRPASTRAANDEKIIRRRAFIT
jgi:protein SDA1